MHTGSFWTALVWAVIPFVALLIGVWWVDRYEKEPWRLLGLALLFGGILAPAVAYGLDRALGLTTSLSSQLTIPRDQLGVGTPLVEELVLGAAILLVLLIVRREIDDALDGLLYGGVVGIGFGAAANFVSIWATPSIGSANGSLFASTVTALNHVFYGAVIGFALGLARRAPTSIFLGAAAAGTAAAFGVQVLHDYLPWLAATSPDNLTSNFGTEVLRQAPNYLGIVALAVIALWTVGREKMIVAHQLHADLGTDVVTHDEYVAVTRSFVRWGILGTDLLFRGERVWRTRRALYHALVQLAFRQFHRGHRESTKSRHFHEEETYRQQIAELRARLHELHADAARVRRTEKPGKPRHHVVAGAGGLAAVLALVGAGAALWYLAFQPTGQPTAPTVIPASAGATPTAAPALPAGVKQEAAGAGLLAAAAASRSSVTLLACEQIKLSKCYGSAQPGGSIPRTLGSFVIAVEWTGLHPGDELTVSFYNLATRQPVEDDARFTLTTPNGYWPIYMAGPFPRLDLAILMTYNGTQVRHVWLFHLI